MHTLHYQSIIRFITNMTRFAQWLSEGYGRSILVAEKFGVTRHFVSAVKNGKRRMPPYWIPTINKMTHIPMTTLLEENGSLPKKK